MTWRACEDKRCLKGEECEEDTKRVVVTLRQREPQVTSYRLSLTTGMRLGFLTLCVVWSGGTADNRPARPPSPRKAATLYWSSARALPSGATYSKGAKPGGGCCADPARCPTSGCPVGRRSIAKRSDSDADVLSLASRQMLAVQRQKKENEHCI